MMQEAELEVAFAFLFGKGLAEIPLTGEVADTAFRIGLLSPDYETIALARKPLDLTESFLIGIATGKLKGIVPPDSMARAIAPAFLSPAPSPEARALLDGNRLGEAILSGIDSVADGVQGDLQGVTEGLSLLREVRLETVARRTALELMILERRG